MSWRSARLLLAALGLAAVVYGAASLTGGWLGEPPWWTEWVPAASAYDKGPTTYRARGVLYDIGSMPVDDFIERGTGDGPGGIIPVDLRLPRLGRELISAAVILAGLGLLAGAGWRRPCSTRQTRMPLPERRRYPA
jgi:hypothetical protein